MVYPALLPPIRTPRLPVVDWTDASADLNGLVRFAERRNLVSARVPSHFKRSLKLYLHTLWKCRGEVSGQHHAPVASPPRRNCSSYSVGGWVRPRAGLEVVDARLHSVLAFARIGRASFSGSKRRGRTFVVLPLGIPSSCQKILLRVRV